MTYSLSIPDEVLDTLGEWKWPVAVAVTLVYYHTTGRWFRKVNQTLGGPGEEPFVILCILGWVLSPLALLMIPLTALTVVLWPLSGGLIQPTWRWFGEGKK